MAIDAKIDTVAFTTMPSRLEFDPPEGVTRQMVDGSYMASKRSYGARVRYVWGALNGDGTITAVMAELRTKRNSLVEHTTAFTDPSGTTHTYNVLWPSDPSFRLVPGYLYGEIVVELFQRG
jgi:hypothetical protein